MLNKILNKYKNLNNSKQVYMIVHEIKENKGGMTTAMLERSRIFYDRDIKADIITFDYNICYDKTIENLVSCGKMDSRTKIFNMYNYFDNVSCEKNKDNFNKENIYTKYEDEIKKCVIIKNNDDSYRCFSNDDGNYKFYIKNNKNNEIEFIDFFENFKRYKRIDFLNKKITKISYFNYENKLNAETYFNKNGLPYLSRSINPNNNTIGNNFLLYNNMYFKNNVELANYFLNQFIEDKSGNIIVVDGPGSFPKILNLEKKKIKKYAIVHINHFESPYVYGSKIKKEYEFIFKNSKRIDGIVALTEKQKNDIEKQFDIKNIFVIPNFQKVGDYKGKKLKRSYVIGNLSRLHKQKGLDRLLLVAQKVNKYNKDIKFYIYGSGTEEENLRKNIKDMNLEDIVILKGYTNDIKSAIEEMDILISTSYYEACPLNIIEAMERGVPVISFDINYGPSDIIKDGETGYLIKDGDTEEMAKKILELYQDDDTMIKFKKNSRQGVIDNFSEEKIFEKWQELF